MRLALFTIFLFVFAFAWNQDLYLKKDKDKYGFQDAKGTWKIQAQYEDAWDFSNGLALVKKGDKWGYVDAQNKIIIPFELEKGALLRGLLAQVKKEGKYGLINSNGYFVQPKYEELEVKENYRRTKIEYIKFKMNGKWGVIDPKTGKEVLPAKYNEIKPFYGLDKGGYEFRDNGKMGIIDAQGNVVVPANYDNVRKIYGTKDLFRVYKGEKVGVCKSGKEIVPVKYDRIKIKKISYYDGWTQLLHEEFDDFGEPTGVVSHQKSFIIGEKDGFSGFYFTETSEGRSIFGDILPQENGNIWVRDPKIKIKYFVYDSDLNLLTPISVLKYRQHTTRNGEKATRSVGEQIGVWNLESKKWDLKPNFRNVEYIPELDAFIASKGPKQHELYSSDFKTIIRDVLFDIPTWEGNEKFYFAALVDGKKCLVQLEAEKEIDQYQIISAPFDSADLIYDAFGNTLQYGVMLRRKGVQFYFNLITEKEYGPVEEVNQIYPSIGKTSLFLTEIRKSSGEYIYLDELYQPTLDQIREVQKIEVEIADQRRDFILFRSMKSGDLMFYDFAKRQAIPLGFDSYIEHQVYDFSEQLYDEYGEILPGALEEDYVLIIKGKKDGKEQYSVVHCDELVVKNLDEAEFEYEAISFRSGNKWGMYSIPDRVLSKAKYPMALSIYKEMTSFYGRPIARVEGVLVDLKNDKMITNWSFEPEVMKSGKNYVLFNWYFDEETDQEQKHVFSKGVYSKMYAIEEVYNDVLGQTDQQYLYLVQKDRKWGLIDVFEEEWIPIQYDKIEYDENMDYMNSIYDYRISLIKVYKGKENTLFDIQKRRQLLPFANRAYLTDEEYESFNRPFLYNQGGKWGYFRYLLYSGEIIESKPVYEDIQLLDDSYVLALIKEGEVEIIKEGGREFTIKCDRLIKDLFDCFWIEREGKHLVVDYDSNILFEFETAPDEIQSEGFYFIYKIGKKWTFAELENGKFIPKRSEDEMRLLSYSDYRIAYKKEKIWYANKSDFSHEIEIGKKPADRVYEIEGDPIIYYSKKGVHLVNKNTGKSYVNKKAKGAYKKTRKKQELIYISGENIYLDKEFNKIEINK